MQETILKNKKNLKEFGKQRLEEKKYGKRDDN